MKEPLDVQIRAYVNALVVRFDNRRLVLTPHKHGIHVHFKRATTTEERKRLKKDPDFTLSTAGSFVIDNRVVETNLNLSYEALYILADVLAHQQKEIKMRQISNSDIKEEAREEAINIMNLATEEEFFELCNYFDEDKPNIVCMHLDTIKRRICLDGEMEQKDTDNFGQPLE